MSANFNDLFHDSGLSGMLDYLSARLDAGDLGQDEALAMLGAVHEGLSGGNVDDRHVYQKYSAIMQTLSSTMPEVHDFVVSEWSKRSSKESTTDDEFWGEVGDESKSDESGVKAAETHTETVSETEETEAEAE